MDKDRYRNHPLWIIKKMLYGIKQFIFPIILIAITSLENMNFLVSVLIFNGFLLLLFLINYIAWRRFTFEFRENTLWIEKGVFVRQKQGIALDKITTVNANQTLLEQIFRLIKLKIDSGSTAKGNEVELLINTEMAEQFKQFLAQSAPETVSIETEAIPDSTICFKATTKELIWYACVSNGIIAGLILIASIIGILDNIPNLEVFDVLVNYIANYVQGFVGQSGWKLILFSLAVLFIYLIFSLIVSIFMTFVKYYGFSVLLEKKQIVIQYGLLEKKKFSLPKHKINAVYVKYGWLGQFFNLGTIRIESIGYGDEKGEVAILYPLINEVKKREILGAFLPEFIWEEDFLKPPKRAARNFIISSVWFPTAIAFIGTFVWEYVRFLWILPILALFAGIVRYKRTRIAKEDHHVVMCNGVFGKTYSVLPLSAIQSVTLKQSYFQKRKHIMSCQFSYQSNIFGGVVVTKFIDENDALIFSSF